MKDLEILYKYLKNKKGNKKILLLTTSNRWVGDKELPKSSMIANELKDKLGKNCNIIDIAKLKIFPCEGNVSTKNGNNCGAKSSKLLDKNKNPTGHIRCWASINNKTDEMYKIANSIFESDIIIFFGSIRWGKMNAIYAQLIERLTWLENRHSSLGESNLLKNKECGIVATGHNWNGKETIELEKEVLSYFGFNTPNELSFNWQWTNDKDDETKKGYSKDSDDFLEEFKFIKNINETIILFSKWIKNKL